MSDPFDSEGVQNAYGPSDTQLEGGDVFASNTCRVGNPTLVTLRKAWGGSARPQSELGRCRNVDELNLLGHPADLGCSDLQSEWRSW